MSDFRVDIRVRNNLLLSAMERSAYPTVREAAQAAGTSIGAIYGLLNMTASPFSTGKGDWSQPALKLCETIGVLPDEVFTEAHYQILKTNRAQFVADMSDMARLAQVQTPDELLEQKELSGVVQSVLSTLTQREQHVLNRHTIEGETYDEIAKTLNVSRERVRQINEKALLKLRHPSRLQPLENVIGKDEIEGRRRNARIEAQFYGRSS